jgi:hypothetical protein
LSNCRCAGLAAQFGLTSSRELSKNVFGKNTIAAEPGAIFHEFE